MAVTVPDNNAVPFATSGLKNEIPIAPSGGGLASMTQGFPTITMQPLATGGIAPAGQDFNGILNQLSSHQVFLNAGGVYKFDADFADDIGGYSKGFVVLLDDGLSSVQSTVDNNETDPNSSMTGWQPYGGKLVNDAIADLETAVSEVNPVASGTISIWPKNTAPSGYLECAGQAVSRTTYAALFAVIGTTFGAGDGSDTFNVPDLRAEFVRGWDHGRGVDTGRTFGSAQSDELKAHSHDFLEENTGSTGSGGAIDASSDLTGDTNDFAIQETGGTETRPRNIALMYIIKT